MHEITPTTEYIDTLIAKGLSPNDAVELEKILEALDISLIVRVLKQVKKTEKAAHCSTAVAARSIIQAGLDAPEDRVSVYVRFNKGEI